MAGKSDAHELYRFVSGCIRGGAPTPAGIFGPYGVDRGLREELLKQTGIVCGKISSSKFSQADADKYIGLCQVCQAAGVLSETDMTKIMEIVERSLGDGSDV